MEVLISDLEYITDREGKKKAVILPVEMRKLYPSKS